MNVLVLMIIIISQRKHTHNITNNITRDNHNNYEHNVIKKLIKIRKHVNSYDTDINYLIRSHLIKRSVITFTMILLILERMK